ncbi:MAG: tRNA-dihydrouridine synthase family protein [Bacteroides sp.]
MTPIHFAPLQGYTEAPYRDAHAAIFGGIDTYYTPFVRLERGEFRRKDARDVAPESNHVPRLVPQLLAPTLEKAETILALFQSKGYTQASINLGCPYPTLAKRHNGAGILPYPQEVEALLQLVTRHPDIRFSVKMRLGWGNAKECLALAPLLNGLPLEHVTLHPRLGQQQYKGEADLDAFAAFAAVCEKPLIYNGDLLTIEDIKRTEARFPALAGMMVGRGLLANPALAMEYAAGEALPPQEWRKKVAALHAAVYLRYEEQLQGGDEQLLHKVKPFWDYLEPALDRKVWKTIHKSGSLNNYLAAVALLSH